MSDLGVVVLAAGLSRRMGGPNKLLMLWRGKPMAEHVLDVADTLPSVPKVLVVHRDVDQLQALLAYRNDWRCVTNDDTISGLASSLQVGLRNLANCTSVVVLLADMPDVSAATFTRLIQADHGDAYAVVPTYEGQWGNPVLLHRAAIDDCANLSGDQGARHLLLANKDKVCLVDVNDPAIVRDFDVVADFSVKPCAPNQ